MLIVCVPLATQADDELCRVGRFQFEEAKRLFESGQMLLTALSFSPLRANGCNAEIRSRSWVGYALATHRLSENGEALTTIDRGLRESAVRESDRKSLLLLKSWILGTVDPALDRESQGRWRLWQARFETETFRQRLDSSFIPAAERPGLTDLQRELANSPRKSLWVSGVASALVPGAGQAYAGNWQAAGLSFVINAIFLAATLEFARKDLPAAATASAGVFSITYIGNILSAVQSANGINEVARAGYETDLKSRLLPELSF